MSRQISNSVRKTVLVATPVLIAVIFGGVLLSVNVARKSLQATEVLGVQSNLSMQVLSQENFDQETIVLTVQLNNAGKDSLYVSNRALSAVMPDKSTLAPVGYLIGVKLLEPSNLEPGSMTFKVAFKSVAQPEYLRLELPGVIQEAKL